MSEWKKRRKDIAIPGMDTPKTYECKICGSKIVPRAKNKHICKENKVSGGLSSAFSGTIEEPKLFDCFDCPTCGCQMVAKERLRKWNE